jgi:acetyl-CoA C-acetyltransferase
LLVGVGTAAESAPVTELMTQACRAAAADAGAPSLLAAVDRIALPQGSWSLVDPARIVVRAIGATGARTYRYEIGVSQQEIINDALAAIVAGDADVILVMGAEARAHSRLAGDELDVPTGPPDVTVTRQPDFVAPVELAAGIVVPPVQQYALIENALAAHEQTSLEDQQQEIARLWARFNDVAQENPLAAFGSPRTAGVIAKAGRKNRPLAFPYNVWHASQWTVDQGAALLICAAGVARDAGVTTDRWVFPHVALHSSQAITLTARRDLHAWPAMEVLGRAAADHLGHPLAEIPIMDVYSCFPAAVRVQQRALGLNRAGTPTVTGGMTFGGGPFNNYVFNATAAVVQLLRQQPEASGLVTTVCGMLSKPGLAVWSASPPESPGAALVADLAGEAAAHTATCPVADPVTAQGPATVASFTVTFDPVDRLRPVRTAIVADLGDGTRTAATCEDATIAQHALTESLIGRTVHVERVAFSL